MTSERLSALSAAMVFAAAPLMAWATGEASRRQWPVHRPRSKCWKKDSCPLGASRGWARCDEAA